MSEVMGEWRRAASPCRGALVLWLKDMLAGAGLGVLDHRGDPKVAYHYLRRALAPRAVWTTDEGVNGVTIHVANDRSTTLTGRLRVALYRELEAKVAEVDERLELEPHGSAQRTVEGMLGRFVDAAWAYRFGPPAQDAIVVSLYADDDSPELVSQAFRFPAGLPTRRESSSQLGLGVTVSESAGEYTVTVRCRQLAYGVRVDTPGFVPGDDAFSVEPGGERVIRLRALDRERTLDGGTVTALNCFEPVRIERG
jgi:beta-mannosidase